jgi:hypothetical protein
MLKLSMLMDGLVHVEGSLVQERERLDKPKEHLCPGSVDHYIL